MSVSGAAHDRSNARGRIRRWRVHGLALVAVIAALAMRPTSPAGADTGDPVSAPASAAVPDVLTGDTWLRHHREDLMPYWDQPAALGDPVGNFPSFRDRNGDLIPASPDTQDSSDPRALSTLARQVYGYSLSFMLTGQDRYLTYAKAGLDWIDAHAKDPVYGGYYGDLNADGSPVNPQGKKDLFDLASLGLAYGMYFNVTRDPAVENELLAVRDLIFDKYYDPAQHRMKDSLTYDLSTEVDTGGPGENITDLLIPATAVSLSNWALLSDPARQTQFKNDLRELVSILIANHKNDGATNPNNRFYFWGPSGRFGSFSSLETDFGHNLLSYAVIYDANHLFPDRPWDGLSDDRARLLSHAWDGAASRWNERIVRSFATGNVEPDSGWWMHDEGDQLLATLDLSEGFTNTAQIDQLARSAQTFLDIYVDRDPAYPARETFARIDNVGDQTDLRKTFAGKNMDHNFEHALIMYLHGQALEGKPATLYYAFPADQALTAVAEPYWFNSAGQTRTVTRDVSTLAGHKVVEVSFTGIGQAAGEPYPAPNDTTAPTTTVTRSPDANQAGWNDGPVTLDLNATDDPGGVGVKEVHVLMDDQAGLTPDRAVIEPGAHATVTLSSEGDYDVSYYAVDLLGNREPVQTTRVRVDRTPPTVSGLPEQPCAIWPPNDRMVTIAHVVGADALSGLADLTVDVTADEPDAGDVLVDGGTVQVRAFRDDEGDGRVYTVTATATDAAGNVTVGQGTCTVPHDQRGGH
ncbi:MAG: AGE family epimerase/isomerase [Nocardioides sp.]|nr:AGE family epimerase/isomerase [Nocardioides sp.]